MQSTTSKDRFKAINLVYFAMTGILTLFALLCFYLAHTNAIEFESPQNAELYKYVIYVLAAGGTVVGYFIFKKKIANVKANATLRDKLSIFMGALLVRAACLELPGWFGVIATIKTGDLSFLLFTGIMLLLMLYFRPTKEGICDDMKLSESERAIWMSPEGIID